MAEPTDWPRLLSLAVHELRTPVGVVGGCLRMLESTRPEALDQRQRHLLDMALSSWSRTADLLAALSELGKLEAGASTPTVVALPLDDALGDACGQFVPPPEVPVALVRRGATGLRVLADPERLRRAFLGCLLALAREMPDGGELVLETGVVPGGDRASIVFATASWLDTVRVAATEWGPLDEWRGGVGLELPLARRAVERAHGSLRSPVGTRQPVIRCELPAARADV